MPKISAPTLGQHRAETIGKLLHAFGKLVLDRGYADVSLADVASEVGLARTAIYTYFADREALLFEWTDREVRQSLRDLTKDLGRSTSSSGKLEVFITHQLTGFATRHLPPGREVMQLLKPETYAAFMHHIEPLEEILESIVDDGIASGEFVEQSTEAAVSMVMACIGSERVPLAKGERKVQESAKRVSSFVQRAMAPS